MAYNQYSGYGGNPYNAEGGGQGGQGLFRSGGDGSNPYDGGNAGQQAPASQPPNIQHQASTFSQQTGDSQYSQAVDGNAPAQQKIQYVSPGRELMSNQDFLQRVEAVKSDIRTLTTQVGQIASAHQRTLSSPDSSSSAQLESLITQTQVLNTSIKDQIKHLEIDAARSKDNQVKNTQITQLKNSFSKQLQDYRQEEASYEARYREQIARQYRIVNPEATDAEVKEAAQADWRNEGVFQTALKSNRSATANTVLGAVRARHNDIVKIEQSIRELNELVEELATIVVLQDVAVKDAEEKTGTVKNDTEAGNQQLDKGIEHARRARKLKWWCLGITVAIVIILGLILGLYFGLKYGGSGSHNNNNNNNNG